jgi:hypothetical protein
MKFKKGDKVLCIDDDFSYGKTDCIDEHAFAMIKHFPKMLVVYTVLYVRPRTNSILLAELRNPILINGKGKSMEEVHWHNWRFVKLKKTQFHSPKKEQKQLQLDLFEEVLMPELEEASAWQLRHMKTIYLFDC